MGVRVRTMRPPALDGPLATWRSRKHCVSKWPGHKVPDSFRPWSGSTVRGDQIAHLGVPDRPQYPSRPGKLYRSRRQTTLRCGWTVAPYRSPAGHCPRLQRLSRYSSTHWRVLLHWPSEPFCARRRPRSIAARRASCLRSFPAREASGTSRWGPATAGTTKRSRLSRTARAISSPRAPGSPLSARARARRYFDRSRLKTMAGG